jgi:RHS repeat-associated protein
VSSYTYTFSQAYDSIHNITHKTQTAMQDTAVNPQITYDNVYSYPAPGSAHPRAPTAIGPFTITNDADGNQVRTLGTGTSAQSNYLYDEENRLSCANMGPQTPSPSCSSQGATQFIYDHAGVRKVKSASSPTIYPNQYYTDFGGGTAGNQFKHIFIGSERILTKKARIAPDRQHWYYHPDHLGSTAMVTNEKSQLVDALHYFPFGEVWLEERPSSLPADYFFTAKEFDPETGFYNFGARYLDPRFSKWMTADPALGSYLPGAGKTVAYQSPSLGNDWQGHVDLRGMGGIFEPKNVSPYSYAAHNPQRFIDLDGREYICSREANCVARDVWAKYPPDPPKSPPGPNDLHPQTYPIHTITLHHTGSEDTPEAVETLQRGKYSQFEYMKRGFASLFGLGQNYNWPDVGYHFLIDEYGVVYEARSQSYEGAHVAGHNPGNVGVAVLGNYWTKPLNERQLTAIERIITETRNTWPNAQVLTHGQFDPGKRDELMGGMGQLKPLLGPPPPPPP